jgi:D-hydroxyproline dehydrogenase subunit gamma
MDEGFRREAASTVTLYINGQAVAMPAGSSVAAAMLTANASCHISVSGEARTALCGMGTCFECRAVIDGIAHRRTCQLACRDGMIVETQR